MCEFNIHVQRGKWEDGKEVEELKRGKRGRLEEGIKERKYVHGGYLWWSIKRVGVQNGLYHD